MDFSLNARQQEVVGRAREVAEVLAANAALYDREGVSPTADFDVLRDAGFHSMVVPEEYGGWGYGFVDFALVMHELAQGSASTATAYNMHHFNMRTIADLGTEEQKRTWFDRVVQDRVLIGSWGSEPGTSFNSHRIAVGTTARREGDEYVVNGRKYFCTLAAECSYAVVLVVGEDRAGDENVGDSFLIILPLDDPGLVVTPEWDVLGLRATFSPPVTFTDVRAPADHVLAGPGVNSMTVGQLQDVMTGYAAIATGLSRAALDFSLGYLTNRRLQPDNILAAHAPHSERLIGEMYTQVEASWTQTLHTAWRLDHERPQAIAEAVGDRARSVGIRCALNVTSQALDACGGSTVAKQYPLERYYREAKVASMMVPTLDVHASRIGRKVVAQAIAAQATSAPDPTPAAA